MTQLKQSFSLHQPVLISALSVIRIFSLSVVPTSGLINQKNLLAAGNFS